MKIDKWIIKSGEGGKIEKGIITLEGNSDLNVNSKLQGLALLDIVTDKKFQNGTISLDFKTNDVKTAILITFEKKSNTDKPYYVGHSIENDAFMIGYDSSPENRSGLKYLNLKESHELKVEVFGSNLKLYIDNIELESTICNFREKQLELRLATLGKLSVSNIKVNSINPKAFIVMEFGSEFDDLYSDVIVPICDEFNIDCIRSDEFCNSTPILNDITTSIEEAQLIIVDITHDNPNVFYELGYSHALKKETILICDKNRSKLPFDVSNYRTLFYENTISGKRKLEEKLRKYITSSF